MQQNIDKVRNQLSVVSSLQEMLNTGIGLRGEPLDPVMRMFFDYLLVQGRFFTPVPSPPVLRIQRVYTPEHRFRWATFLALSRHTRLWYAEGVCCLGNNLFHHAWCTTGKDEVVDNTVDLRRMNLTKAVYYGVDVHKRVLKDSLIKHRSYGLFSPLKEEAE